MTPDVTVETAQRVVCLRQVSYAKRDYALMAAQRITKNTGRATEIVPCRVCHGFHVVKKGEL